MDLRQPTSSRGRNLLHLAVMGACVTGWMGVCRYLVEEKGFDANSTSTEGNYLAPRRRMAECYWATELLAPSPIAGETPIFVATESNHAGVVPLLNYFLGRGGNPAAPDARGCMPLHNAAEHGALISHSPIHLPNFLE